MNRRFGFTVAIRRPIEDNAFGLIKDENVEETGCKEVATVIFQREVSFSPNALGNKKALISQGVYGGEGGIRTPGPDKPVNRFRVDPGYVAGLFTKSVCYSFFFCFSISCRVFRFVFANLVLTKFICLV